MDDSARPDEFYVGYLPTPRGIAMFLRVVVPLAMWSAVIAAALTVWTMDAPGGGEWDTGHERTWTGRLVMSPYPMLLESGDEPRLHLMVEMGKFAPRASRFESLPDGSAVTVRGFRLQRDGRTMIELAPNDEAITLADGPPPAMPRTRDLGPTTLRGEIMDSKCFLGAMRPGEGRTHRACAILCVAGGIPPMLVTRDASGVASYVLLTSVGGGAIIDPILEFIAEPVEIRGRLSESGGLLRLAVDPDSISRL